ncbi:hypothetical protein SAMN05443144_10283 [Fodinibius roseus]|uniref:Uncharacterized protein n=1 Tax=Fodinibius roseus TaxID=1194090 RepID=A0A1M4UN65_9BACT|nr:hypothetical protein SAMN05443144_10283 [Fodinibius roseus]
MVISLLAVPCMLEYFYSAILIIKIRVIPNNISVLFFKAIEIIYV